MDPKYIQQPPYSPSYPSNSGGGFQSPPAYSQQPTASMPYPSNNQSGGLGQPGYNYQTQENQGVHPSQVGYAHQYQNSNPGYQYGPQQVNRRVLFVLA